MKLLLTTACSLALLSAAAIAEEKRDLSAHEHGVAQLNVAIEGNSVVMEFEAPGADIVGFEHPATSDEDKQMIKAGISTLEDLTKLVNFPEESNCTVTEASAELHSEDEHDEHGHDDHHAEAEHSEEHEHDDHAEAKHSDEHGHDEHHAESEEAGEESHTEFHAEYALNCENIDQIDEMTFPYFDAFENAEEIEVQIVTESGASKFEVMREKPRIDLSGMI
ncbi:MAG: DUF2796 domain-containing protein [Pseudomonadota bacterium]